MWLHGDKGAGAYLGLAGGTIKRWRIEGKLVEGEHFFKRGRNLFFKSEAIDELIMKPCSAKSKGLVEKILC